MFFVLFWITTLISALLFVAHAAEEKNMEVANFYLSKMTETCIKCHSRFAKERFPGLVKAESHAK